MFAIAGIDGTGDYTEAEYARRFRSSFVRQLTSGHEAPNVGRYSRGPTVEGASTAGKGEAAAKFITEAVEAGLRRGQRLGVFLTGFSRGGGAAIHAARMLAQRRILVDALFLFDAVDRAIGLDVDEIPNNVRTVYHAMRSKSAESREFFGNCGTRFHKTTTAYHSKWFHCTHGAIGGTPWTAAGSDGSIYEGDSFVSHGMLILLPMPVALVARTVYENNSRTRVTLAQEQAGSAQVLEWMRANFDFEKDKVVLRQRLEGASPGGAQV
jgi:hypothetical protein